MDAHTPAPWSVEEYGDRDYPNLVIHSGSEMRVCFMATPGSDDRDPVRIDADARLIAAAPELLESLKAMLSPRMDGPDSAQIWFAAEAAVAKAEGRS